jgi:hypothetical protein
MSVVAVVHRVSAMEKIVVKSVVHHEYSIISGVPNTPTATDTSNAWLNVVIVSTIHRKQVSGFAYEPHDVNGGHGYSHHQVRRPVAAR